MDQFIQFVIHHWALWLGLLIVLILIFVVEMAEQLSGGKSISPQEAVNQMNHVDATVIDIRSNELYRKGTIIDAQNIPMADITTKANKLEKFKDKPLILVCANGQESAKLAGSLKKQGFKQVSFIKGGISGWTMVELPLTISK